MNLESVVIDSPEQTHAVVIWLHGLGADGYDFVDVIPYLDLPKANSIRFVFPHAPSMPVTLNGGMIMPSWFDIESLSLDARQDEAGLKKSQQAISALIEKNMAEGIGAERHLLIGFSQGGALALQTGLRFPHKIGGVAALSSYLPLHKLLSAQRHEANHDTAIFLAHGKLDPLLPYSIGKQSYSYLKELNYNVAWHEYDMAHEVCLPELKDLGQWIKKTLNIRE